MHRRTAGRAERRGPARRLGQRAARWLTGYGYRPWYAAVRGARRVHRPGRARLRLLVRVLGVTLLAVFVAGLTGLTRRHPGPG